jgi:hypothetical protein
LALTKIYLAKVYLALKSKSIRIMVRGAEDGVPPLFLFAGNR